MNDTNSEADDVTGQYCTNCEAFLDHTTPVNTSHSSTGDTGCPECLEATVAYVVLRQSDERSITNAYIPQGAEKITLESARGEA